MKEKKVNVGFRRAVERLGVEGVADVLGMSIDGVYRIKRGENNLKLEHAAKLYSVTKIGWSAFREWE
jgi:hypothetical protein